MSKWYCTTCGDSNDVWFDAYVNANDELDVQTFDNAYCGKCEGETKLEYR